MSSSVKLFFRGSTPSAMHFLLYFRLLRSTLSILSSCGHTLRHSVIIKISNRSSAFVSRPPYFASRRSENQPSFSTFRLAHSIAPILPVGSLICPTVSSFAGSAFGISPHLCLRGKGSQLRS
ncbi:hypothetical protein F4679DRAFT_181442 [Xylaria curta]|nr:hypothetical protein F4679DRAFT_181442 [Xylaria curta]